MKNASEIICRYCNYIYFQVELLVLNTIFATKKKSKNKTKEMVEIASRRREWINGEWDEMKDNNSLVETIGITSIGVQRCTRFRCAAVAVVI